MLVTVTSWCHDAKVSCTASVNLNGEEDDKSEAPITMRHPVENNEEVFLTLFKILTTKKMA